MGTLDCTTGIGETPWVLWVVGQRLPYREWVVYER